MDAESRLTRERGAQPEAASRAYRLPAGSYLFMQFRPRDAKELEEGLEWFAREAWWEGAAAMGPWIVRRVREDGRLATQVMRRKGEPRG